MNINKQTKHFFCKKYSNKNPILLIKYEINAEIKLAITYMLIYGNFKVS
jgi:hypothetical protein